MYTRNNVNVRSTGTVRNTVRIVLNITNRVQIYGPSMDTHTFSMLYKFNVITSM